MNILDINVKITCKLDEYLISVTDSNGLISRSLLHKEKVIYAKNPEEIFEYYISATVREFIKKAARKIN